MDCLLPQYVDAFKQGLIDGSINPQALSEMSSKQRAEFLSQFVGKENQGWVNALFESKLLLKNQKRGMISWAKKVSGVSKAVRADMIKKIENLKEAIDPKSKHGVLNDLVDQRLGLKLTDEEASKIMEISSKMTSIRDQVKESLGENATRDDIDEGLRNVEGNEYYRLENEMYKYIDARTPRSGSLISNIVSFARSLKLSFDMSFIGRQGRAYLGRKEWFGAAMRAFKYAKSESNIDQLKVKMLSSKYRRILTKYGKELGLTILGHKMSQREELWASEWTNKIPGLAHSERANVGFINDLRFNRAVNMLDALKKSGADISENSEAVKSLFEVIAAGTGRGHAKALDKVMGPLSTALLAPRWIASQFNLFLDPVFAKGSQAKIEAAKNLGTVLGVWTAAAALKYYSLDDDEREKMKNFFDPFSSDFLMIKVGNTTFDMSNGLRKIINLMLQLALAKRTTQEGKTVSLKDARYGAQNRNDLLVDFFGNRAAPVPRFMYTYFKGKTYEGKKFEDMSWPEFSKWAANEMLTPLIIDNALEAYQKNTNGKFPITVASAVNEYFGGSSYTQAKKKSKSRW